MVSVQRDGACGLTDEAGDAVPLHTLVRGKRLALRLTQRQAAANAGVSVATWQSVERPGGTTSFQELTLARIATALALPHTAVFGTTGRAPSGAADTGSPTTNGWPSDAEGWPDAAELISRATDDLHRLAEDSEADLALVCGIIRVLAGRLLS